MKQHFRMFAAYNKWANGRIYEAASQLSHDEFERNTGAFFKSMMGTLNHLLVADRIWMKRFTGEGDAPTTLDAILARDFARLRAAAHGRGRAHHQMDRLAHGEGAVGPLHLHDAVTTCARSRSGWRRRSPMSSTTRPTIAARRT